eukprot:Clim_evm9s73 gene=Clim_evmTU9s73
MLDFNPVQAFVVALTVGCYVGIVQRRKQNAFPLAEYEELPTDTPADAKRKVVVTGGAGFLGNVIVRQLLERGDSAVTCFDVLIPKQKYPGVRYIKGDVRVREHLERAFEDQDSVIHVASILPGVGRDQIIPVINVEGTKNVVDACGKQAVSRLVYTSSATVAIEKDDRSVANCKETEGYPDQTIDVYTESKVVAEKLVLGANSETLHTSVCRPGAVFGPGDKQITDMYVRGEANFCIGEGEHDIDWIHVDSVAHGHVLAEEHMVKGDPACGEAFNITSSTPMKYRNFRGTKEVNVGKSTNHWGHPPADIMPINIVYALALFNEWCYALTSIIPLGPELTLMAIDFTQRTYWFNTDKARKLLGYKPLYTTDEGIKRTREVYEASLKPKNA